MPVSETWRLGSVGNPTSPMTVLEAGGDVFPVHQLLATVGEDPEVDSRVLSILQDWSGWRDLLAQLAGEASVGTPLDRSRLTWLPPVCYPRKLIVCGINYRDHVTEMGQDPARIDHPFTVLKPASTSLIGAGHPIVLPEQAEWIDWEGELGVVIGCRVRRASFASALEAVAGFCPVNDVSARDWIAAQIPGVGMDWTLHKGFDGFTPAGPLMTPAEFVDDPQRLRITLSVNGKNKQDAWTDQMIFGVRELIEHLTSVMTLEPGDMLLTGSPGGSGFARTPRERLCAGDEVCVAITGLGELVNPVTTDDAPRNRSITPQAP